MTEEPAAVAASTSASADAIQTQRMIACLIYALIALCVNEGSAVGYSALDDKFMRVDCCARKKNCARE